MNSKLFEYFRTAYEGEFLAKVEFNRLKSRILKEEGTPDGYDIHKRGKMGPTIEEKFMLRYILNGQIFHLFSYERPKNIPFRNRYSLPHIKPVLPKKSYMALIMLILYYEPERMDKLYYYQRMMEILEKNMTLIAEELKAIKQDFKMVVNQ